MARLHCTNTCYMPVEIKSKGKKTQPVVDRFEDEEGGIYEVEDDRVEEFISSGNFVRVAE